jgi:predicted DNA-binding transcriptional regulator AlpA
MPLDDIEELRHHIRLIAQAVSPREIEDTIGVSYATVYRFIADENPTTPTRAIREKLQRFADAYDEAALQIVSRETHRPGATPIEPGTDAVNERGPSYAVDPPRVSAGLPYRLRVWLQSELTEYVKARVSEREFAEARAALESPELLGFFVGGGGGEQSEDDVLEDMKAVASIIRRKLRRRSPRLAAEPVE